MNLGQRNKVSVTGNMSSMTDLVFLLLIFFVMLSTLVSRGVEVELPSSEGTSTEGSHVTISINEESQYSIDEDIISRDNMKAKLEEAMAKQEDKVLYVKVDKNVPTGQTVEIIGIAKKKKLESHVGLKPERHAITFYDHGTAFAHHPHPATD